MQQRAGDWECPNPYVFFFFIVYHFGFLIHFVGLSELFNSCNLCFQGLWQSEFCLENGV